MSKAEHKFLKEYIPLAKKFHEYDKKFEDIQKDIQQYVQIKLIGKYNSYFTVGKYEIKRAKLDKDKKYLTMTKLESKYRNIRDNYGDLALKWQDDFQKKYSLTEYLKYHKKYFG